MVIWFTAFLDINTIMPPPDQNNSIFTSTLFSFVQNARLSARGDLDDNFAHCVTTLRLLPGFSNRVTKQRESAVHLHSELLPFIQTVQVQQILSFDVAIGDKSGFAGPRPEIEQASQYYAWCGDNRRVNTCAMRCSIIIPAVNI